MVTQFSTIYRFEQNIRVSPACSIYLHSSLFSPPLFCLLWLIIPITMNLKRFNDAFFHIPFWRRSAFFSVSSFLLVLSFTRENLFEQRNFIHQHVPKNIRTNVWKKKQVKHLFSIRTNRIMLVRNLELISFSRHRHRNIGKPMCSEKRESKIQWKLFHLLAFHRAYEHLWLKLFPQHLFL